MSNAKTGPWNAETIRQSRKARGLTQAELAESLGCRQQTISEWELGMYEPKNAYQKLLSLFFGSTPVVKEEVPAQNWGDTAKAEVEAVNHAAMEHAHTENNHRFVEKN